MINRLWGGSSFQRKTWVVGGDGMGGDGDGWMIGSERERVS